MILQVDNLAVARGGIPVLAGVSFSAAAGEAIVLRGPNGSGKTTLLRTLAGLQPALEGRVVADEDSIAYASHADGVKSMLSVDENLRFWAQVFGTKGADQAIDVFDLGPLRTRLAGSLSAGQKRRLGLARMAVTGRPIWLFDEPTVSLDAEAVQLFAQAVRGHLDGGGAAVIATHIDLGLPQARELDIAQYRAEAATVASADEAFL